MEDTPKCSYCLKKIPEKHKTDLICECTMCLKCIELLLREEQTICSMCKENFNFASMSYNSVSVKFQACREIPRNPILDKNLDNKLSALTSLAHQAHICKIDKNSFEKLGAFDKLETIKSLKLKDFYNLSLSSFSSTFLRLQHLKKIYNQTMLKEIKAINSNSRHVVMGGEEINFSKLNHSCEIDLSINDKNLAINGLGIIMPNKGILKGRIKGVNISVKGIIIFQRNFEFDNMEESIEIIYELSLNPSIIMNDKSANYKISFDIDEGHYFVMKHAEYYFNDYDVPISIANNAKESLLAYLRFNF